MAVGVNGIMEEERFLIAVPVYAYTPILGQQVTFDSLCIGMKYTIKCINEQRT